MAYDVMLGLAKISKAERVQPKLAHDALSDCEAQIGSLALAYKRLRISTYDVK